MDAVTNELRKIMDDEWPSVDRNAGPGEPQRVGREVFGGKSNNSGVKELDPTPDQRQHIVKVAQFLSNVTVPTISKATKAMEMPPGRLRTREGVRRSAERSRA